MRSPQDASLLQLRTQRRLGLAEGDGGVGGVVLAGERLELGDGGVVGHLYHANPLLFFGARTVYSAYRGFLFLPEENATFVFSCFMRNQESALRKNKTQGPWYRRHAGTGLYDRYLTLTF